MDLETPRPAEGEAIASYLAFVNRWLGGTAAIVSHLRDVKGPATVLDVASGAADVTRDLARRYPNLTCIAFDLSAWALALAPGVPRVRGDVHRFPFGDRSVDYIIATHFFHHLADDEIVTVLREFDRVARRGIVVNDLIRNRRALAWIRLLTLGANRFVKRDGPLSVLKGFTVPEVEALASRAGMGWLRVRRHFGHRFTLAGERPGSEPG